MHGQLDPVARSIYKYGSVTVSAPILVDVNRASGFKFDLDKPATFYYDHARVEGAVWLFQQQALDMQTALSAQLEELSSAMALLEKAPTGGNAEIGMEKLQKVLMTLSALKHLGPGGGGFNDIMNDPALKAGLAWLMDTLQGEAAAYKPPQSVAEAIAKAADDPADNKDEEGSEDKSEDGAPEESDFKSVLPITTRPAQSVLYDKKFSAPLGHSTESVTLSPRQTLLLAANDKITQDLLRWLSKPEGYGDDKTAYLCIMTVACQPGWKTRRGYAADVTVTMEYGRSKASPEGFEIIRNKLKLANAYVDAAMKGLKEELDLEQASDWAAKAKSLTDEAGGLLSKIAKDSSQTNNAYRALEMLEEASRASASVGNLVTALSNADIKQEIKILREWEEEGKENKRKLASLTPGSKEYNEQLKKTKEDHDALMGIRKEYFETGSPDRVNALKKAANESNAYSERVMLLSRLLSTLTGGGVAHPASLSNSSGIELASAMNRDFFLRPMVTAVYPMIDAQVLDLRSSFRDQIAIAAQLTLMGYGGQIQQLMDYVKQTEQDASSMTARTIGSAYSANGYNYGFRVEPRYAAIENPVQPDSRPGYTLESTQFPAMVLLFADKAAIASRAGGKASDSEAWDHVVFHTESRWIPMVGQWPFGWRHATISEDRLIRRARNLDYVLNQLPQYGNNTASGNTNLQSAASPGNWQNKENQTNTMGQLEWSTLYRRRAALAALGLGSSIAVRLPEYEKKDSNDSQQKTESITVTVPEKTPFSGWKNTVTTLLITGSGFSDKTILGANVGGRDAAVKVLSKGALVVVIDPWGIQANDSKHPIAIATNDGVKQAGTVTFNKTYKQKKPDEPPSVKIKRDERGNIIDIIVSGTWTNAREVLNGIKEALPPNSPEGAIGLNLRVSEATVKATP